MGLSPQFVEPPALNNNVEQTWLLTNYAVEFVRQRGYFQGPFEAFSWRGYSFDYKNTHYTFQLSDLYVMKGSEYTNWLTAYSSTYLYGMAGNWGVRGGGHFHALMELHHFDEAESRYFISGGVLMADERRCKENNKKRMSDWDFVRAKIDLYRGIERMAETDLTSWSFDQELDLFLKFWNSGSPRW